MGACLFFAGENKISCLALGANVVSPLEFLFYDPADHFLCLIECINRDSAPLLKVVVTPTPGNDHRTGEKQGSLDGDQVPAVEVIGGFDMTQ